ncbi:TlpA family protein disulfide reductase [Moritella viscosa]|uniref:Thiol:disulfide interchange protein DsbE, putative n=1 Tax=Moritella viscosa TaxID=80854 RepID=A0A1K9YXR5_9GAMM|nr:TlpA disulfide reductase family protein [Moritella viscosa]SGY86071.1 Thiol:disulfide interchange protein DsbE, putative [Moritella viscosa]SGY87376.1 Thiol:disulfide interchange protein DsbE, putative [Moritella viscosa]SGY87395.1 Thiol:disulfide interchange protein DsbE, putative [Moritella viscosa]SGY88946.1 Thiol:disulfide interchange protein DsbE, putative [Moritella viscosa]SGY89453.1 Thiol:disulfide interchange protein DsbE, putative [Moritella viscosa]
MNPCIYNRISSFFITVSVVTSLLFSTTIIAESKVSQAPIFALPGIDNTQVNLEDYRGKVVLVDFWASWCTPCIRSFPWMDEMVEKYGEKGFVVIAINMDQESILATKFLQRYPNKLTIAFDPQGAVAEQYEIMGLPNSFILNKKGEIVYKHIGFRLAELDKYEAEILSLLP